MIANPQEVGSGTRPATFAEGRGDRTEVAASSLVVNQPHKAASDFIDVATIRNCSFVDQLYICCSWVWCSNCNQSEWLLDLLFIFLCSSTLSVVL